MSECRRFSCIISLLCTSGSNICIYIDRVRAVILYLLVHITIFHCCSFRVGVSVDGEMQKHAPYDSLIDNHMAIKMYTQSVSILYVYCVIRSLARVCVCTWGWRWIVVSVPTSVCMCVYASGYATNELKTKIKSGKHRRCSICCTNNV